MYPVDHHTVEDGRRRSEYLEPLAIEWSCPQGFVSGKDDVTRRAQTRLGPAAQDAPFTTLERKDGELVGVPLSRRDGKEDTLPVG